MDSAVIITGAGSGLGRATALALARRQRPLYLVGRNAARLLETQSRCLASGLPRERCATHAIDICELHAAEQIVATALDRFQSVGAVVNNAGVARFAALGEAQDADWLAMFQTNLFAPARLIRAAVPALRACNGVAINVGSIGGLLALPGRAMYGASKAALMHFTRSIARELAPDIRVNAIVPGAIDTEMYETLGMDATDVQRFKASLVATTPLGRMGEVADVVPWIELLLSEPGKWVTGSIIVIDGGRAC